MRAVRGGARWDAALWLRNDGENPLDIFPLTPDCFAAANCLSLRAYPALLPNQDGFRTHAGLPAPFSTWLNGRPGVFLYVERAGASRLSAHLEIGDSSRDITRTTLPIVPETDFVAGRHSVVAIPLAATIGVLLRFALRKYLESPIYTGRDLGRG